MMDQARWVPFSNAAYGANALYVPEWGVGESYEFIFSLVQNFPEFKAHPVLDIWHMYHTGKERFDHQWEYRITPWVTDLKRGAWSYLYLPDRRNDVRGLFRFYSGCGGRLRVVMTFENPDSVDREWQLNTFFCRNEKAVIGNYALLESLPHRLRFGAEGRVFTVESSDLELTGARMDDSNYWVNFPFNVENSGGHLLHNDRFRERLQFGAKPLVIPAGGRVVARLDFIPAEAAELPAPEEFDLDEPAAGLLPVAHEIWEAYHNQEYARSFGGDYFTGRPTPAKQWGDFWFWDTGFVVYAAADFDESFALDIIREMPDPAMVDERHGSYVPTVILGLWKLYSNTGRRSLLEEFYPMLRRMIFYWIDHAAVADEPGMFNKSMGAGSDDNPCSCYCSKIIFSWGYHRTLPRNARREYLECIDVEVTGYVLRMLRTIRLMAAELGIRSDVELFTGLIGRSEAALERHWSEERGCYLYRAGGEEHLLDIEWLGCYNPLFAGAVGSPERRARMLGNVADPARYWTKYGVTAVAFDSPDFRPEGYPNGCIWSPSQFFYWLGFYNLGEMGLARELIDNYLGMFEKIHGSDLMCWEQFRAENGTGSGNARFSSFVLPIVSMWKSRREYGRVTVGFDTVIVNRELGESGALALTLRRPFDGGVSGASAVLKPRTGYRLRINGADAGSYLTDGYGFMMWSMMFVAGEEYRIELLPE